VFTHLLALIIGNSAYAFGLILAAFLSCLFVGASRASWAQRRFGDAALPLGLALSGLGLALSLPAWDKLPYFFDNTGQVLTSFAAREATRAIASFVMLVIPTTLMGLTARIRARFAVRFRLGEGH
jgi:spermidine synthase